MTASRPPQFLGEAIGAAIGGIFRAPRLKRRKLAAALAFAARDPFVRGFAAASFYFLAIAGAFALGLVIAGA